MAGVGYNLIIFKNILECFDKSPRCVTFAEKDGYCEYHKKFMIKHCPYSCGFCSPGKT